MSFFSKLFRNSDSELAARGLPTKKELNPHGDPDGSYAERHFKGKTLSDAEIILGDGSALYYEDLMWMGPKAFSYYLPAALTYLMSDDSRDDDDTVNQLLGIFELRIKQGDSDIENSRETILKICRYVIENNDKFDIRDDYSKYDAQEHRYIGLAERYEILEDRLKGEKA